MAVKGDKLLKHITSSFINDTLARNRERRTGNFAIPDTDENLRIIVRNHTNSSVPKYTAVQLDAAEIDYTGNFDHRHERLVYNTADPDNDHVDRWAVLQEPLPGEIGREAEALLCGVTWVKTAEAVGSDKFLKMSSSGLVFSSQGKAYAVDSFAAAEGYNTLIVMAIKGSGGGGVETIIFTLTSDLAPGFGETATATVLGVPVVVVNTGGFFGPNGTTGMAILVGGAYYVVHINQKVTRFYGTLAAGITDRFGADPRETNAAITGTLVALTNYPDGFNPFSSPTTVPNPNKLWGEAGDGCLIAYNADTGTYYLEEVFPQRQNLLWAKLLEDTPYGTLPATVSCSPLTPASDGAMPSDPFNVIDRFNVMHNAKEDDVALVIWDAGEQEYVAIDCTHVCTAFIGEVTDDWDDARSTFDVDFLHALNGRDAPATVTVFNRWNWRIARSGDTIEVHWDHNSNQWYPLQIEPYENILPVRLP